MKTSHIIIVSIASVLLAGALVIYAKMPVITLKGERETLLEVNAEYKDLGVKIKNSKLKPKVIGKVDNQKIGTYKITYEIEYFFTKIKQDRFVKVVDTQVPIINLVGSDVKICPNKEYREPGYEANDNYDGDLTDKVVITKTKNKLTYEVKDSSNNETKVVRKYEFIDDTKPKITLNNGNINLYVGEQYKEPGYKATDNCDDSLTDKVISEGAVDTGKVGSYEITYKVKDSSNNETTAKRKINVVIKENKTIYLTFDDGPSSLTSKILDTLKKYNVNATFFVAGYPSASILKREVDEGNAIGLHTTTHSYKTLYTSEDGFFNDINMIGERVKNAIGYVPDIMRFPGGSSNTVSRNYNKGIMTRLAKLVQEKGFQYFDWNVDSKDASGRSYTSKQICNNVVNGIKERKTSVVLMHDLSNKKSTYGALPCIIEYGKSNGYEFKTLTKNSPVVHHGINN